MKYEHHLEVPGSVFAAARVVDVIFDLVGPVRSVVDLGGGTGAWCQAFKLRGAEQVVCLDHPAAQGNGLLIEPYEFRPVDLSTQSPAPVASELAVCVEFAEHVSAKRADWIVEFLTASARTVVFSAAVPEQGGVGHVNEQWPDYWTDRFKSRGFTRLDLIRPLIMGDHEIPYWYRQNLFLYTKDPERFAGRPQMLPVDFMAIHTSVFQRLAQPRLKTVLKQLLPALFEAIRYRFRKSGKKWEG